MTYSCPTCGMRYPARTECCPPELMWSKGAHTWPTGEFADNTNHYDTTRKAESARRLLLRRKAAGICAKCGRAPAAKPLKRCRPCLDREKRRKASASAKLREESLANSKCVGCGKTLTEPKFANCASCRFEMRERARRPKESKCDIS